MAKKLKRKKRKSKRASARTAKYDILASRESLLEDGLDAVDVQISAVVKIPKGYRISRKVVLQAIRWRANNPKKNPPGMILKIIRWRNPDADAKKGKGPRWRGSPKTPESNESQTRRWLTLGRFLQGETVVFAFKKSGNR